MGPLLFLIYFNDLPYFIGEQIDCYADDSTISASGVNINEVSAKLTSECSKLNVWMMENQFKLNANKTHLLVVGSSVRLRGLQEPNVFMNSEQLKVTNEKRESLLEIQLQDNLKWYINSF